MKYTKLCFAVMCFLSWSICSFAQSDDIEITDSTSTGWDGGTGGGINPHEPDEPVTSLTISQSQLTLEGGECVRLVATVNPRAMNKRILWSSANSNIASVESDGTVMGWAVGTTTITATAAGNTALKQTCRVTVTSDYVPPVSGYILPWGRDEAWAMKYQQVEYSEDPGDISWTKPGFDDSSWPTLTGPMGDDGRGNYDWEGDWNGFNLRRTFIMSVVDPNATYTFYANHDDDLWIYLNGNLVAYFDGWSEGEERPVEVPASMFVRGTNQLALRIMEKDGGQYLDYALYQKIEVRKGDVNSDGRVDLSDAIMVTYYSLHQIPSNFNTEAADMNDDGEIDLSDAIIITYMSLGVKQ